MNRLSEAVWTICILLVIAVSGCSREAEKANKAPSGPAANAVAPAIASVQKTSLLSETTVLAAIANDESPPAAYPSLGFGLHPQVTAELEVIFAELGGGAAYAAEKNGKTYVSHNGKAGRLYDGVGTVVLSRDGRRIAYGANLGGKWRMVLDGTEGKTFDAVGIPVFSPDGRHLAYQAMTGQRWLLVIDGKANSGTETRYVKQAFSADSSLMAWLESGEGGRKGRLVVSGLTFNEKKSVETDGDVMLADADGGGLAVVDRTSEGQRVLRLDFNRLDVVETGPLYDAVYFLAFGPNASLAYFAERGGKSFMTLDGAEEALPGGSALAGPPVVRPGGKAVGAVVVNNNKSFLYQAFAGGEEGKKYDEASGLAYSKDGGRYAYAARRGADWFVVTNGREGPAYDRIVTPVFSPDGRFLVYRARKDGMRFLVVADAGGKTVREHPKYEQVFQPVFTSDGKSVAYGVKDGPRLVWKVEKLEE